MGAGATVAGVVSAVGTVGVTVTGADEPVDVPEAGGAVTTGVLGAEVVTDVEVSSTGISKRES